MNCSDFKEQVGAWALGALSAAETREMEEHLEALSKHEGCQEALDQARLTAAQLSLALPPVHPGEKVWPAIESSTGPSREKAPPAKGARKFPYKEALYWAFAAGMALTIHLVSQDKNQLAERANRSEKLLTEARGLLGQHERCLRDLQEMKSNVGLQRDAIALLQRPATKVVALEPTQSGSPFRGSAIVNLAEQRTIIVSSALPRFRDQDFELWIIRGTEAPVPAGLMHQGDEGITVGEIGGNLLQGPAPDAFAVSREAKGGSATGKPSEAILMVGKLPS